MNEAYRGSKSAQVLQDWESFTKMQRHRKGCIQTESEKEIRVGSEEKHQEVRKGKTRRKVGINTNPK